MGLILFIFGYYRKNNLFFLLGLLIVFIFSLGSVSELLWRFIEKPYVRMDEKTLYKADAIVVLSGSLHPAPGNSKIVEWKDPDRFLSGIKIFKSGKAPLIIFTGGYSPYESNLPLEGDVYIKKALSLGIDNSYLYSTNSASNTAEESYQTKRLLQKKFYEYA